MQSFKIALIVFVALLEVFSRGCGKPDGDKDPGLGAVAVEFFYAEECAYCGEIRPVLERLEREGLKVKWFEVESPLEEHDAIRDLLLRYHITILPAVIVKTGGSNDFGNKVPGKLTGRWSYEALKRRLSRYASSGVEKRDYRGPERMSRGFEPVDGKSFRLDFSYDMGDLALTGYRAQDGAAARKRDFEDESHIGAFLDGEGNVIYLFPFIIPRRIHSIPGETDETSVFEERAETAFSLALPFFEETREVRVFDENGFLLIDALLPAGGVGTTFHMDAGQVEGWDHLQGARCTGSVCKTIVFIGNKFDKIESFRSSAQGVFDDLLKWEPFKSRTQNLQGYYVKSVNTDLDCWYDCSLADDCRALSCWGNPDAVIAKAPGAPRYDIAVVIHNDSRYGGTGGDVIAISANKSCRKALAHEIGHSSGRLNDEYVDNQYYGRPAYPSGPNCRVEEDDRFKIEGCSRSDWYRAEQNCKMKKLDKPFCSICLQEMKKVLDGDSILAQGAQPSCDKECCDNSYCPVEAPFCSGWRCVACRGNQDCPPEKTCDGSGKCAEGCNPRDETCNGMDDDCDGRVDNGCPEPVVTCSTSEDCSGLGRRRLCDPLTSRCVECVAGGDCGAGYQCAGGECRPSVPGCGDGSCGAGETCSSCSRDCGQCPACGPDNCPGCCRDGACAPGDALDACGTGGEACDLCGVGETCEAGRCACASHARLDCHDGDAYWFDSCGNPEEKSEECGAAGCAGSACIYDPCAADQYEPNDSRSAAWNLGSFDDTDETIQSVSDADIRPAQDEDWFYAFANNTLLGDLRIEVGLAAGTADLDLCVTFACEEGSVSVVCKSDTDEPVGSDTCCSARQGAADERVLMEPDGCGGAASGFAYIRVSGKANAAQCDYLLTYRF